MVTDWDDTQAVFLVEFGAQPSLEARNDLPEDPFGGKHRRQRRSGSALLRDNRFRFRVLKGYGSHCGACDLQDERLIQAAHIVPVSAGGADVPTNGIPLCPTHHFAFDSRKVPLTIEPDTLNWILLDGQPLSSLSITRLSLLHLNATPSFAAIQWHFEEARLVSEQ